MSGKHSEAVEHLMALNRYCINIENCNDCAIQEHCRVTVILTKADEKKLRARAEELDKHMVTCFKCHGAGSYVIPVFDSGEFPTRYKKCQCEICKHTGKITLEFYEMLQRKMREK